MAAVAAHRNMMHLKMIVGRDDYQREMVCGRIRITTLIILNIWETWCMPIEWIMRMKVVVMVINIEGEG